MAENKGRLTYHQPAFVVMTTRGSFAMVREAGLEPAREISHAPQTCLSASFSTRATQQAILYHLSGRSVNHFSGFFCAGRGRDLRRDAACVETPPAGRMSNTERKTDSVF